MRSKWSEFNGFYCLEIARIHIYTHHYTTVTNSFSRQFCFELFVRFKLSQNLITINVINSTENILWIHRNLFQ